MYKQVRNLDRGLLLAGLTVLVKDTANFLHEKAYTDPMAEEFRQEYLKMLNHNRYYWELFGSDLYQTLPDAGLPHGIVAEVVTCNSDISPLCNAGIERESTRAPGWHFFENYTALTQNLILDDSSLDQEKARLDSSEDTFDIVEDYVERLTSRSEIGNLLWSPIMLYVALLIIKTYFVTFTEA